MRKIIVALALCASFFTLIGPASADDNPKVEAAGELLNAEVTKTVIRGKNQPETAATVTNTTHRPTDAWAWLPTCATRAFSDAGNVQVCASTGCPPGLQQMRLWRIHPAPRLPGRVRCVTLEVARELAATPVITPDMVLRAFRSIGVPTSRAITQPAGKTLINFDTIFYTRTEPFSRTVTLLGQQVRLDIKPIRFDWVHGDGTTSTTNTGGDPYPAKTIVYRYQNAHVSVEQHVEVTWGATYSVNGGPSQPVPGTVNIVGPATTLRVAEAVPALSGRGH